MDLLGELPTDLTGDPRDGDRENTAVTGRRPVIEAALAATAAATPGVTVRRGVAVAGLLADPARARAMGAAGRRRVEDAFSWPAVVARLEQLLATAAAAAR
jgi:glycosyltransferase involved in cell wall biosynthesis